MQRLNNSWNPFDWLKATQNWFTKTERSSGFRPYLIYLIIHAVLACIFLTWFSQIEAITTFVVYSLYASFGAFIFLFGFKAIQDPNFCRSEKHIEAVKRIEVMEQSGDAGPIPIDTLTIKASSNPEGPALLSSGLGGQK
jgi:hypothetical protein